jgi:hypothetical protein
MTTPRHRLFFHPAIRACLSEGRPPELSEVEQVAAKIWGDSYRCATGLEWHQIDATSHHGQRTVAAASAALRGTKSVLPKPEDEDNRSHNRKSLSCRRAAKTRGMSPPRSGTVID